MRINKATKTVIIGSLFALILAGISILVWFLNGSEQEELAKPMDQMSEEQISLKHSTPIELPDSSDSIIEGRNSASQEEQDDKDMAKKQADEFLSWLDSLETENQKSGTPQSTPDSTDDAEQQKTQNEMAKLEHQKAVESVKQRMVDMVLELGEVVRTLESFPRNTDSYLAEKYIKERRRLKHELAITAAEYVRLTGDHAALLPGGWFYKLSRENGNYYKYRVLPS